ARCAARPASAATTPTATATARRSARATSTWSSGTCSTTRPRPAAGARATWPKARSGFTRSVARCHVPDWHLMAHNSAARDYTERYDGDRRFFELQVGYNEQAERLEGKLVYLAAPLTPDPSPPKRGRGEKEEKPLTPRPEGEKGSSSSPLSPPGGEGLGARGPHWKPRRGAYTVRGVYSDFKYHDVGPGFYQVQFDGSGAKQWRPPPLWGGGTTAPYGHDGASLDLDAVIRRHGGEALASRQAYAALDEDGRRQVIAFLESLLLYQTDQLPCDLDGDGRIAE